MKKKVLLAVVAVVLVVSCLSVFVGCSAGKYTYTVPVLGTEATIKLGLFGSVTFDGVIKEVLDFGNYDESKHGKIKYKTVDNSKDVEGKTIEFYYKSTEGDEVQVFSALLNKDGDLIVGIFKFVK